MDKRTYFLRAMREGCYRYKQWVIEAFSLTRPNDNPRDYPMALIRDPERGYGFREADAPEEMVWIEGTDPRQPLFAFSEEVTLHPRDLVNLNEAVVSTYGQALVNQTILCHPFADRIDYINKEIEIRAVQKIVEKRLRDDLGPDEQPNPKHIYVHEYKRFAEAVQSLSGYNSLCVVSATRKTITADPRIREVRARLLEENKDRLHDPVVQAKIEGELKKIDRDWMRGDPGERFYINDKAYSVVRKKLYIAQGTAEGFGTAGTFIPTSLDDGWDERYLSDMVNQLRDGSYSRGAQTALAGEVVKFNNRIFQNTGIVGEDCGTKLGMAIDLTEDIASRFISSSIITAQGLVMLTEENIAKYTGKTVTMRYPTYCQAEGANFCATCAGKNVSTVPNAISTYVSNIGSLFMNLFMKAMHGKSLKVVEVQYISSLS